MKQNKEILDEFGKILINGFFDFNYEILFKNLSRHLEKNESKSLAKETISNLLFEFLKMFEEFKIYYETEDQKINLAEISEMLKAESIIENDWISRFSEFK